MRVAALGLGCMEMEFVHGVRMRPESASSLKPLAEKSDVVLTAHGPYYINLNSKETEKRKASRERVLRTAHVCNLAGGWSITFHAAFLMKMPAEQVHETVRQQMKLIMEALDKEKNNIWVRPETAGKQAQWGTIDQILDLGEEWPRVMPCVDFAHIHAYENGRFNTYDEFRTLLDKVEGTLGTKALKEMHMHVSGIDYGAKGEKKHLGFKDPASDFNYKDLLRALKEYDVAGCLICESPELEKDAKVLKKAFEKL
jgi:deoxyribonuclease-4